MTAWPVGVGALLAMVLSSHVASAADPRYPDWPCQQAKVPEISLAAVWAGPPLGDAEAKWKDDPKINALATKLAARRVPLEEAQKQITEFLQASAADKANAGKLLFAGLFDTLNGQRASVMNGLERVMRKQREAAERSATIRSRCKSYRTRRRRTRPRSMNSATSWSGRPESSRTAGGWSNSSARCRPPSISACSRWAAPLCRNWIEACDASPGNGKNAAGTNDAACSLTPTISEVGRPP